MPLAQKRNPRSTRSGGDFALELVCFLGLVFSQVNLVKIKHSKVRINLAVLGYHIKSDGFWWAMILSTLQAFLYSRANGVGVDFSLLVLILDRKEFAVGFVNEVFHFILLLRDWQ